MAEWNWEIEVYVAHCYKKEFPFHVRGELADFFNRNSGFLRYNLHSPSGETRKLIDEFIVAMRQELQNIHDLLPSEGVRSSFYKRKFRKYCDKIQSADNFELFLLIREALEAEGKELRKLATSRALESMDTSPSPAEMHEQTKNKINDNLHKFKINCDHILKTIVQLDKTCTELRRQPNYQSERMVTYLKTQKAVVDPEGHECIEDLGKVQVDISEMLEEFKDKQRFVTFVVKEKDGDGSNLDSLWNSLDDVHVFLCKLAECLAVMFDFSRKYKALFEEVASSEVELVDWSAQLCRLQNKTKAVCCVMECQPPQIIRTTNKYQMKLRLLPWTNRRIQIAQVQLVLMKRSTADEIKAHLNTCILLPAALENQAHPLLPECCGTISTDPITLDHNPLYITGIQITQVKGGLKKTQGKHTFEERFWIYCRMHVNVNLDEETSTEMFHTISLPISVVSHTTSQEMHVVPQMMWFNACPAKERKDCGLTVPATQPWTHLLQIVNLEFIKLGGPLNPKQVEFLKMKLLRWIERPGDMVTEEEFCGTTIKQLTLQPKKPAFFSFGEWLYGCLAILNTDAIPGKKSLKELWATGKIVGFIKKPEMEEMLISPGMCIIFFPESAIECIGIQFIDRKGLVKNL